MAVPSLPNYLDSYRTRREHFPPPALTSGLTLFLVFIFVISQIYPGFNEALALNASAITHFNLNRLSFYPICHLGILHLVFNLWALLPLVRSFELANGTVRTGIVLNIISVVPGLVYAILAALLFPETSIIGASGWVFTFLGYFAYQDYLRSPTVQITPSTAVPTWTTPVVPLILCAILLPGSSFIGHTLGLFTGYAMAMGYLDKLIEPSTNVVEWIEVKVDAAINLIPGPIHFLREVDAREIRATNRSEPLPTTTPAAAAAAATAPATAFQGPGQTLGTA